ncbi:hypothetical protein BDV93DRAFT_453034, partial [Ceratobasidium sp. AG-I]
LLRLITNHIQLRQHLRRVQAVDTPVCSHCQEAPETVACYLLRWPTFADIGFQFLGPPGYDFLRLDYLFFAPNALSPLFDYVEATNTFADLLR